MGAPPGQKRGPGRRTLGKQPAKPAASPQPNILHMIPAIMRKKGWEVGARFQEYWFAGAAARLTEAGREKLDIVPIRLDWVLGFERAREDLKGAIKKVSARDFWKEGVERSLKKRVAQAIKESGDPARRTYRFPPDGWEKLAGRDLDKWEVEEIAVGSRFALDGLQAALGRFCWFVVPVGQVTFPGPTLHGGGDSPPRARIAIEKIVYYIQDTFDFNDVHEARTDAEDDVRLVSSGVPVSQPLGFWNFAARDVARVPLSALYIPITNWHYRLYRTKTGRGRDFLVYSNTGTVSITPIVLEAAIDRRGEVPVKA